MTTNPFSFLRVSTDVMRDLAIRARQLRLEANITQAALAEQIGVSTGTLKNFEKTGEIQLRALLELAEYLGRLNEFDKLFLPSDKPASLFDYKEKSQRQRARRGGK